MPEEIEVPLEHAHEHIEKVHEELHGGEDKKAEREKDGWTRFVAVVTALLAVIAAIGALRSGVLVNGALIAKNDEVSHLTRATDQWNYYQAKSIKAVVYATTAQLLPAGSPAAQKSLAEVRRYEKQQEDIRHKAEALEAEKNQKEADRDMDRHHIFAFSVSLCQIAIALSAVAALTRNRWVWRLGLAAGCGGVLALIGGFLGLHLPFEF